MKTLAIFEIGSLVLIAISSAALYHSYFTKTNQISEFFIIDIAAMGFWFGLNVAKNLLSK